MQWVALVMAVIAATVALAYVWAMRPIKPRRSK